jgi:type IV secretion system protein VirB6
MAGLLSGLVTIFVALIGYRLILGQTPGLRDGVGWAVRLGLVLALVTSWPAFQTLVFRVAADGPGELAVVFLPASGLPSESLGVRIQQAYDTMRLGAAGQQTAQPPSQGGPSPLQPGEAQPGSQPQSFPQLSGFGYTPLPQTASAFVITTAGITAGFKIAVGFLLAVAPLAILGLLFDATWGLFSGWVRALAGAALGLLAATIVTALDLIMVEGELANLQRFSVGGIAQVVDPQGLTTIVLLFGVVSLVATLLAVRMAGAFQLVPVGKWAAAEARGGETMSSPRQPPALGSMDGPGAGAGGAQRGLLAPARAAALADALTTAVRREQIVGDNGSRSGAAPSRHVSIVEAASRAERDGAVLPLGAAGRRSASRQTLSARARDRTG